ncbi:carbon-nitrogen family hydrolase [Bacillaceae bacterium Marseille-Q3522]|nr:carbon-nitrogen family hydrolase [Bacillaceae bacterium Marseille-Q3522]
MKLKIMIVQMDIAFGQPVINFEHAENQIKEASLRSPHVIVLPELWTTGYDLTRLNEIGDCDGKQSLAFLQPLAKQYQINIIGGSVANKKADGIYNSLFVIDSSGDLVHQYDKLHLFQLMDEHKYLTFGKNNALFHLCGKQFAGFICYDIRFPEWLRVHSSQGAEAIFVVAEWPLARLDHWRALLIARAIENQCFVIACNRVGKDPNNVFAGHSMVIDPWGNILAEEDESEGLLEAEIDLTEVQKVREKIPIFADRKPSFYQ